MPGNRSEPLNRLGGGFFSPKVPLVLGWRREDPKHVVICCPNRARNRQKSYEAARTNRYQDILSTGKGFRAVAWWVVNERLLAQFSLAKEQIDRVEGRQGMTATREGDASERE